MAETGGQQLLELWKKQVEEGSQAWLKMLGQGQPADPQSFWRPFMDQSIAAWSKALEQAMGTDTFAQAMGKQMETFLNTSGPAKKAAEQQIEAGLAGIGLPSRSQVVGLASQIVQLEDKVDRLEDRLDTVLKELQKLASAKSARG